MSIVIFFILIVLLFFLSQQLTTSLSRFLLKIFHHQKIVIHILSFMFLPGVIVHELSHLFVANILFVPTGEIEFLPEIHGNSVKMGSVAIAQTDPLRRFVIGAAPFILGLGVLFLLFLFLYPVPQLFSWQTLVLFYSLFEIGNTMFSSNKDMEGALGVLLAGVLSTTVLYFLHVPILEWGRAVIQIPSLQNIFSLMDVYIGLAVLVDIVVVLVLSFVVKN